MAYKEELAKKLLPELIEQIELKIKAWLSGIDVSKVKKEKKVKKVKPTEGEQKEGEEKEPHLKEGEEGPHPGEEEKKKPKSHKKKQVEAIEDPDSPVDLLKGRKWPKLEVAMELAKPAEGGALLDLNQVIFSQKDGATIGKLAESIDVGGVDQNAFKSKFEDNMKITKHLIISKDLSANTTTVRDMRDVCPPEAEPVFEKLDSKLEEFMKKYNKSMEELLALLGQMSGSVAELERYLKGENVSLWKEIEDMALQHPEDAAMQKHLAETKSELEIAKRKKYLGIS